MKERPDLQYLKIIQAPAVPTGREDKPDLPFKDLRVRQALNLAVNQQEIVDSYYKGNAVLLGYPWPPEKTYESIYTPLDQQPDQPTVDGSECSVQELFTYNPDKAKQLLSEAGYPDGFKTTITCETGAQADFLSVIRDYFLKVGVDMEIQPLETGTYISVYRARSFDEMLMKNTVDYAFPFRMLMVRQESFDDPAYFESDKTRAAYDAISAAIGIDDSVVSQQLKEIGPYILEEAWGVWMPAPYAYIMWWPWVKNYHGEQDTGYFTPYNYSKYIWIDQTLKKSMGY